MVIKLVDRCRCETVVITVVTIQLINCHYWYCLCIYVYVYIIWSWYISRHPTFHIFLLLVFLCAYFYIHSNNFYLQKSIDARHLSHSITSPHYIDKHLKISITSSITLGTWAYYHNAHELPIPYKWQMIIEHKLQNALATNTC